MIFVHSSFRTASTFLWSSLRKSPQTVAYYEIFNEGLNFFSGNQIMTILPEHWHSGHPPAAPYFLEFLPLLRNEGGVEGFDPTISYERFIPPNGCGGDISDTELSYVKRLIAHAEGRGRTPVLTATRSLGRFKGLKSALPGLHVLLCRNLFQQWCSVTDQAVRGNPFFLNMILDIIKLNQHDQQLRELLEICPVETASVEDPNAFYLFVFFHLYLYVQAAGAADLIVDINRLAAERPYRENIEDVIGRHGVTVDLSAAKNSIAFSVCPFGSSQGFTDRLRVIGEIIIDRAPDPVGRDFGTKLLADLIEEQARHAFHTQGLRSILLGPSETLTAHRTMRLARDAATAERNAALLELRDERDAARGTLHTTDGERGKLRVECNEDRAEISRWAIERNELQAERDAALASCNILLAESNTIAAECEALRQDRDALHVKLEELACDRDGLRLQRDDAIADRDAIRIERDRIDSDRAASRMAHDGVLAECDTLRRERDAALADQDTSRAQRHGAESERDAMRMERDRAVAERDAAIIDQRTAVKHQNALRAALDAARDDRDAALVESKIIRVERDKAQEQLRDLTRERDAAITECNAIRNDRERIKSEQASLIADRDALESKLCNTATERDDLRKSRDAALAECETTAIARDRACNERDALSRDLDAARAERAAISADQQNTSLERDAVRAEVAALMVQLGALSDQRDRAFSDLHALLAKHEALLPAIDALNGERNHFAADRDRLRTELHIAQVAQEHIVAERDKLRAEVACLVARRGFLSVRRNWLPGRGNFGVSALRSTR